MRARTEMARAVATESLTREKWCGQDYGCAAAYFIGLLYVIISSTLLRVQECLVRHPRVGMHLGPLRGLCVAVLTKRCSIFLREDQMCGLASIVMLV